MKNLKRFFPVIAIYSIVFVIYNILYYIIPFPKTAASWVSYVFSLIAIIVSFAITFFTYMYKQKSKNDLTSKVYGFSVFRVGVIYFIVQVLFGIAMYVTGCFVDAPVWIPITVSIIILGITLIITIATNSTRNIIEEQETKYAASIKTSTMFKLDISSIVDICKDPDLKKALSKLSEEFRYSDPVSSPELNDIEDKLSDEIASLKNFINTDNEAAKEKVEEIGLLLVDRNRRCKALK